MSTGGTILVSERSPLWDDFPYSVKYFRLPGAESVLSHPLFLQQAGVLQFDGAGDEAHLAALLHQPANPPVVVVLLWKAACDARC